MAIGIVATDGVVGSGVTVVFEVSLLLTTLLVSVLDVGAALQLDLSAVIVERQLLRLVPISQLYVPTSRELLLCIVLLHWFRGLERIYGSARFLALVLFSVAVFPLVVGAFAVALGGVPLVARPGPFAAIYACLVVFWCDVPPTFRIGSKRLAPLGVSDKWFVYALALQLAVAVPSLDSLVSALAGLCCGILHRSPHLRMNRAVAPLPRALLQRAEFTRRTYESPVFRRVAWLRYWTSSSFDDLWSSARRRGTPEQQARIDGMLQPFRIQRRRPQQPPPSLLPLYGAPLAPPPQQPPPLLPAPPPSQQHLQQLQVQSPQPSPPPPPPPAPTPPMPPLLPSAQLAVQRLVEIGFPPERAIFALGLTGGDVDQAADLLLSGTER